MIILLSNDDGVYAPGLSALQKGLSAFGEVYTVAPLEERSTTGHTLSLTQPLRLHEFDEYTYGCSGFPADCVLMGIGHILKKKGRRPDIVISGINKGSNLGQDTYYSGTAAAAREGIFHGVPGIALSLTNNIGPETKEYYENAASLVKDMLLLEIHKMIDPLTLININVPNVSKEKLKGIELTHLALRQYSEEIEERIDFRNRPYYWIVGNYLESIYPEGSDCHTILKNKISFTELNLLHKTSENSKRWKEFFKDLTSWS